jgi:hypothetical protein
VAEDLLALGRLMADDVLVTSESVLIPGKHALDIARSIGEGNPKYSRFVVRVFDALREMTKAAQAHLAEIRKGREEAKAAAEAGKADASKTAKPDACPSASASRSASLGIPKCILGIPRCQPWHLETPALMPRGASAGTPRCQPWHPRRPRIG